jgi:PEP-CTERM motif
MKHHFRSIFLSSLVAMGLQLSSNAQAVAINVIPVNVISNFDIVANCQDCATVANQSSFQVTGNLKLSNYSLGDTITLSNFSSFTYDGSNIINPFSITSSGDDGNPLTRDFATSTVYDISGAITANNSPNDFLISFDDGLFFRTFSDGAWAACAPGGAGYYSGSNCQILMVFNGGDADNGDSAIYNPSTNVPAPATLGLLCLGLAASSLARRKHQDLKLA